METQQTTLIFILQNNQILLAEKKRGFGVGKINGIGGKVETGETIEQAMIRETQEEIGVTPLDYTQVASITFKIGGKDATKQIVVAVYIAKDYEGEITETEEMRPTWFNLNEIPYDRMFSSDKIWLPEILNGKKINGEIIFDKDFNTLSSTFTPLE